MAKKSRARTIEEVSDVVELPKEEKKETSKAKKAFSFADIAGDAGLKKLGVKYEIVSRKVNKNSYRIPFNNVALQAMTGGIIGGTFCEIGAQSQGGKCLAKGTLVATVKGPVPIESLVVGDMVIGYNADGTVSPVRVTNTIYNGRKAVHELRNKHNIFAEATLEHNWASTKIRSRVETQHEVNTGVLFKSNEYRINRRFVDYEFGDVSEPHAYAIGALLGDGCSRQGVSSIHISSPDDKIPNKIKDIIGANECYRSSEHNYTYIIANSRGRGFSHDKVTCNMYDDYIKDKYAHEKSLPFNVFADWDRESLLNLLSGLIDTDGSVYMTENKYLTLEFSSTSDQLAELYRTLVYTIFQIEPRLYMDVREGKRECFSYGISDNPTVVRLLSKLGNRIVTDSKKYKPEYEKLPFHISDKYVGVTQGRSRITDVYDITVDNETHMFVLHSGLVTHNSFLAYELMANCQKMGGVVLLNDGEGAFDIKYADMVGLDVESDTFIKSRVSNIQEYYSLLITVTKAIRAKDKKIPILSVCDSFPTLNTQHALDARGTGDQLGFESKLKNRAWSEQMETFVPFLEETMSTHIMVNQFTKIEVANKYMNPYVSLCEEKMQYWATQRLKGMLKTQLVNEEEIGGKKTKIVLGARTEWTSIKNRSVKPFQKVMVDIVYSRGVMKYSGFLDYLFQHKYATVKTSKFDPVTGEELSKAQEYIAILPRICGDEDVRLSYDKKRNKSSNLEFSELIENFPHVIEPVWTGTYDDGEVYESDDGSKKQDELGNDSEASTGEEGAVKKTRRKG